MYIKPESPIYNLIKSTEFIIRQYGNDINKVLSHITREFSEKKINFVIHIRAIKNLVYKIQESDYEGNIQNLN